MAHMDAGTGPSMHRVKGTEHSRHFKTPRNQAPCPKSKACLVRLQPLQQDVCKNDKTFYILALTKIAKP